MLSREEGMTKLLFPHSLFLSLPPPSLDFQKKRDVLNAEDSQCSAARHSRCQAAIVGLKMAGKDLEKPSPVVLFRDLREKARQLGLRDQDVSGLPALAEIQCGVKNYFLQSATRSFKYLLFLACTLALVWLLDWPVHNERIIRMWFHFRGLPSEDIELERCLLRTPDILSDALRPPLDCAFCRNVTSVHKVENISPEDFEERYAYSGQPVVVTDATRNWSALDAFSFEFFQQVYSQDSMELKNVENNCQFFPYKTTFRNLREVMQMEPRRARMEDSSEPWYIGWSNCDSSAGNVLRQHYQRPYFLPRVSESSKTDWIFMGSPGYGAHMHLDNVHLPSWQAQITGTKRWTMEPPSECYSQCIASLQVDVQPGEIVVLDTNKWYHSTLNVGSSISITIGSEFD